jgi:hypothetical protein
MPPRSPLAGLAEAIRPLIESLKKMKAPTLDLRAWAEARIDRAMTCPECGHGAAVSAELRAEQAENCDCTDELCVCNDEVEYGEQPR